MTIIIIFYADNNNKIKKQQYMSILYIYLSYICSYLETWKDFILDMTLDQ